MDQLIEETPIVAGPGNAVFRLIADARKRSRTGRAAVALRGGMWSIIGHVSTSLLRMGTTLLLARHFLGPEAFGVVGLVGVFLTGLAMFSELGIVTAVVQHRRGDDAEFLDTAFAIQAGRGSLIWVAAAIASYPLAVFYRRPELFPLLVAAALSELIRGFASTAAWTLNRHVNLRKLTLLTVSSEVAAFAAAITWAVIAPSAWALVVRSLAGAAIYAVGSHFVAEQRMRFRWESNAAKDILHFGGWISLSTAAHFLAFQGERLILGRLITVSELGCFSLALMISAIPGDGVGTLVNQIFLPMIAVTVRTDKDATVRDFLKARRAFFAIAVVAALGFLTLAKPVVSLVLPAKYATTGWMLQLLGLRVSLDVFSAPVSTIVLAYGRSKYAAVANGVRLVLMFGGVWVAFVLFGIHQAIIALVVAQVVSYFPLIQGLGRLLPEVAGREFRWYLTFLLFVAIAGAALSVVGIV